MQHSFQQMALKNRDAIQSAVEEHMSDQKHLRPQEAPSPIHRMATPRLVEPSIMQEFREISSQYLIDQKDDSEAISSNGEFDQADKMVTYNEEDTEVLKIEHMKDWQSKTKMGLNMAPAAVYHEAERQKEEGQQAQRAKGLKHFKQVGYMGRDFKEVPRWAASQDALREVMQHQQKNRDRCLAIFGQLKPRHVQDQFISSKIFSKGEDMHSYMDRDRGSSVDWDDQSEFATPIPDRRINLAASRQEHISQSEQRNPVAPVTGDSGNLLGALGLSAQQPSRKHGDRNSQSKNRFSHISEEGPSRQASQSAVAKATTPAKRALF